MIQGLATSSIPGSTQHATGAASHVTKGGCTGSQGQDEEGTGHDSSDSEGDASGDMGEHMLRTVHASSLAGRLTTMHGG
jgi:hypothetical protein